MAQDNPADAPTSVRPPGTAGEASYVGADKHAELAEQARKSRRMKAIKGGRVVIHSSGAGIDCLVRNLSPSGARLTFAHPVDLPVQFELYLLAENVRVDVNVVWRKGLDAGVKFEKPLDWLSKHTSARQF